MNLVAFDFFSITARMDIEHPPITYWLIVRKFAQIPLFNIKRNLSTGQTSLIGGKWRKAIRFRPLFWIPSLAGNLNLVKLFAFITALLTTLSFNAFAQDFLSFEEKEFLNNKESLKVGVLEGDWLPYWGDLASKEGINIEYAESMLHDLHVGAEYVPCLLYTSPSPRDY